MLMFLSLNFVQHALLASLLASITCGIVGTLIVLNRLIFLAGGIAHAAYGGVGLAIFFRLPVLPTLLGYTTVISTLMGSLIKKKKERTDVMIGAMWASGMSLGVLLLNLTTGYHADLMSYLFGSILAISHIDLIVMGVITVGILLFITWRYQDFLMISFDMQYAQTRGVPTTIIYLILLILTAFASVILIRVVGIILTIALLTIPPFIGMRFTRKLWKMMVVATICAFIFCIGGLLIAYQFNLTAGAAIVLLAALTLGLVLAADRVIQFKHRT